MLWFAVIVILIFLIYFKIYKPIHKWQDLGVPYIKPLPVFGNTAQWIFQRKCMADCLREMYNSQNTRYIGFYEFNKPLLMIKDLDLLKQIGIKDFDHFVDHRKIIEEEIDPLWGKNLISLRGQKWRHMRSTLSPAFTGSKMRSMFILMSDCAEQFTNYFIEETKNDKKVVIEMRDILTRYANDVIASCAFGITCDSMKERNNEFYEMGKDASNFNGLRMLKFFGYTVSPALMRMLDIKIFNDNVSIFFRNIVSSNIKSREEQGIIRPDMIHLLMEARKGKLKHENQDKDEDAGFATVEESQVGKELQTARKDLSDEDITAQAILFFIAGFETISLGMSHMAYELALNEDVQQKLQEEIEDTLKQCNGKITYDAVIKMKYLDMVLSETLRKWPPAVVTDRCCFDSYTIKSENPNEPEIHLKQSDVVWIPIFAIHRDPQYFPNPEKFDPERFSDENKENIKPLSYIPFGVGPRNCIGSRFALLEAKIVFFHILSQFSFEICEKSQVPLRLGKNQINVQPEKGFWLALKPRY